MKRSLIRARAKAIVGILEKKPQKELERIIQNSEPGSIDGIGNTHFFIKLNRLSSDSDYEVVVKSGVISSLFPVSEVFQVEAEGKGKGGLVKAKGSVREK